MDYSQSYFSKGKPKVLQRHRKRVDKAASLAEAYAEVDARDKGICRASGRHTSPGATDPRARREHHHLVPRSRDKALVDDARNIVVLCAEAHQLVTAGVLLVEGEDADTPNALRFHWAASVDAKDRPFVIKSRRKSQR